LKGGNKGRSLFVVMLDIFLIGSVTNSFSQKSSTGIADSLSKAEVSVLSFKKQRDLVDIVYKFLGKNTDSRLDSNGNSRKKILMAVGPILEYTVSTGFTVGISAGASFLTSYRDSTKYSVILGAIKFTQKSQFLLPIQSTIWTSGNKYNLLGDWHYINFPQDTYGFGGYTTLADGYLVDYKSIRFYEYVLRRIRPNFYAGLGYQLDYHWNIVQVNPPAGQETDYDIYGFSPSSVSSGVALDFLYDSRKSSVSPDGGSFYCNLSLLQNSIHLGSNSSWNSLLIDIRKYFGLPGNNILAFWSYNVFTLSGNPPYLDLPGTGTDTYNNTGRGYVYDRFIGKKMIDLETEFRYHITRNGLLGGVVFADAESLSELNSNQFQVISPAVGLGLRIKFNKFSNTNVGIDFAVGTHGSHGFYGNLGEVF
jgi:hypothetical protein